MHIKLDRLTLAKAGASPVLALDPIAFSAGVNLTASGEAQKPTGDGAEMVAVVDIRGPLAQRSAIDLCAYVDGYDAIANRLDAALEGDASSVLLIIDSPGGDVAGLEQALSRMTAAVETSGKPVVAYVDELAASAAYWIAAIVAHQIVVPPSGRVGSIGCIGAIVDETGALEKEGIKVTLIREPAGKAEGHPLGPVTALAEERVGGMVRAAAERFYDAVGARRKLTSEAVAKLNGEVFGGPAALSKGLIDEVGGLSAAIERARSLAKGKRMNEEKEKAHARLRAAAATVTGVSVDALDLDAKLLAKFDTMNTQLEAHKAKAATVDALTAERDELKLKVDGQARAAEVETVIKAGQEQRKLSPAKLEGFRAKAMKHGKEWALDTLEEMPVLIPEAPAALVGGTPPGAPAPTGASLSERELAMCAEMSLDPKLYAADKAARGVLK